MCVINDRGFGLGRVLDKFSNICNGSWFREKAMNIRQFAFSWDLTKSSDIGMGITYWQLGPPLQTLFKTHWGRVTHICVGKLTIIGSDNGLSPGRRQAIIWTSAGVLLIGPLGTNFSEILTGIQTFSFKKMHLKMSSGKLRPFCLGPNVLKLRWGNG